MPDEILELLVTATGKPHVYQVAASSSSQGHAVHLTSLSPPFAAPPSLPERPTAEAELRDLGTNLFATLIAGNVRILYDRVLGRLSEQHAAPQARGLRLLLRMEAPELTILPWELLFDPERQLFLATDPRCTLSRSLTLIEPVRPLASAGPLRILVVRPVSSGLDCRAEDDVLAQAGAALSDSVQIVELPQPNATPEALRQALRGEPHVIHFAGHAAFRGEEAVVVLDREDGMPWPMPAPAFAHLFLDRPSVRLVVLNACEGASRSAHRALAGVAPWLLRRGLPAVVAMQWPITNSAAGRFATELYRELTSQGSGDLTAAMARARGALYQEEPYSPAFANAVLYLRAPDARLSVEAEAGERRDTQPASSPTPPSQVTYQTTGGSGSINVGGHFEGIEGGIHIHGPKRDDSE